MNIYTLRASAQREEIDYPFLMHALRDYRSPRNKVQALLKSKALVRVKKGLYVFGKKANQDPYSKEVLANLIYGPSAVSLEYALAYYGLIPERVETVTSISNQRHKKFDTPVGSFEYYFLPTSKYYFGITQIEINPLKHFLIATKEKALADVLMLRTKPLESENDLFTHLTENLRIDESELNFLNFKMLATLANIYKNKNVYLLQRLLEKNNG